MSPKVVKERRQLMRMDSPITKLKRDLKDLNIEIKTCPDT